MKRKWRNRRGGDGRGFSRKVRKHPGKGQVDRDLREQERRAADRAGRPAEDELPKEVIPGIGHRAYVPALGRQVDDKELEAVLTAAEAAKPVLQVPRTDRPGGTRDYKPEGGTEFFHGQLRMDLFLGLRWGQQQGLPDPNPVLDRLLTRVDEELTRQYGPGYVVEAVCLHMPSPYLEDELKRRGWRVSVQPGAKVGRNNIHLQIYVRRLTKEKDGALGVTELATRDHLFSHALDSVISSAQLRELTVDVDLHRESRFSAERERAYLTGDEYHRTGQGRQGRPLSPRLRVLVDQGKLSISEAIAKAVATDLLRKRKSWAKGKQVKCYTDMNKLQIARAEKAGAVDLHFARWFTAELDRDLRGLDPRYGALIDKAKTAFPELKRREIASGHKRTFNEILNDWEAADAAARQKADREALEAERKRVREIEATKQKEVALAVKGRVGEWLNGLRTVLRDGQPPHGMLAEGFFRRHASGRAELIGGVGSSGYVVQYLSSRKPLTEAESVRLSAAKEFLELAASQKAAFARYDELAKSDGREAAEAFLKATEAEWLKTVKAPPPPPVPEVPDVVLAATDELIEHTEKVVAEERNRVAKAEAEVVSVRTGFAEDKANAELQIDVLARTAFAPQLKGALAVAALLQGGKLISTSQADSVKNWLVEDDTALGGCRWTKQAHACVAAAQDYLPPELVFQFTASVAFSNATKDQFVGALAALTMRYHGEILSEEEATFFDSSRSYLAPHLRVAAEKVVAELARRDVALQKRSPGATPEAWLVEMAEEAQQAINADDMLRERMLHAQTQKADRDNVVEVDFGGRDAASR